MSNTSGVQHTCRSILRKLDCRLFEREMLLGVDAYGIITVQLFADSTDLRLHVGVLAKDRLEVVDRQREDVHVAAGLEGRPARHVVEEVDVIEEFAVLEDPCYAGVAVHFQLFHLQWYQT